MFLLLDNQMVECFSIQRIYSNNLHCMHFPLHIRYTVWTMIRLYTTADDIIAAPDGVEPHLSVIDNR